MKILFLDIDGVLNNQTHFQNKQIDTSRFDKTNVSALNKIVEETNAKVVISSTWRVLYSLEELKEIFKEEGVKADIMGYTESLHNVETFEMASRGFEISEWIRKNQNSFKNGIENYAIIDDEDDFLDSQKEHFFPTDGTIGLTENNASKIIEFLKNNNP